MRPSLDVVLCLLLFVGRGTCCVVRFWQYYSMTELLSLPNIVVFGREIQNITVAPDRVDSIFTVSCVFRSDNRPIRTNITIEGVWPRSGCSVTADVYGSGKDVIVGLKRLTDSTFEWDEKNPLQSIAYEGIPYNLLQLATTCGFQNWTSPDGINDTVCPMCDYHTNDQNPFQTVCLIEQLADDNCTNVPAPTISGVCSCGSNRSRNMEVETGGGRRVSISGGLTVVMALLTSINIVRNNGKTFM